MIPAPLIDLASEQLQSVNGMKNSKIVILLASEVMYFQRPHTDIKDEARIVESFIPEASFPPKLGFIELPYSQGPSFFTNLAIYHEIGHFVYEEISHTNSNQSIADLQSAQDQCLQTVFQKRWKKDPEALALAARIIENWTQEIFCDLFAIRLVGPAFSFALIEILGMLGFLSEKETVKFHPSHPSSACRFAEHVNMLRDDSWWDAIADVKANQKRILEDLAKLPRSKYRLYVDDKTTGPQGLITAFLDVVVPAIRKLVKSLTPDSHLAVKRFSSSRSNIQECLHAGVVPLTTPTSPDPVSIINAAFCLYLTSLPEIINRFEGDKARQNVEVHSWWTKRVEMWTMKAVEDSQIHRRFESTRALYDPL
jgi:hypothetical protein